MTDSEPQLRFARHNFDNLQSLIRFADAKAATMIAFVSLFAGTAYPIVESTLGHLRFERLTSYEIATNVLFCLAWTVFWVSSLGAVLYLVREVIFPRRASRYDEASSARGLMYWRHILRLPSMPHYLAAVRELDREAELRNLTDQCYELSGILEQKITALRWIGRRSVWIAGSWLSGVFLALVLRFDDVR